MGFPKDFKWGAASAAYQIEGAYSEDGKGLNIWDVYSKKSGVVAHGESGDVACDHYHRFLDDIALMKKIGIKHYRFSISWARLIPDGVGEVNEKGVEFYNKLIDALVENGIEPMITLFHWDYPYELHCKGGWLNSDSSEWFKYYAETVTKLFSDRVKYWMTINEPQIFVGAGYQNGDFAPCVKAPVSELVRIAHNVLLSHGKAVKAIRENAKREPIIGFAPTGTCVMPEDETTEAVEFARNKSFDIDENGFIFSNSYWGDPIVLGKYPDKAYELFGDDLKRVVKDGDMETIAQPLDFYGANIYSDAGYEMRGGYPSNEYIGVPRTTMGWPVTDNALYWSVKFLHERYKLPILITENGMADTDWVELDGRVRDFTRIDYVTRYLRGLKRACEEGADVIGYMYWSIMDNFEWSSGYDRRFGLIHVDYVTQKRTVKESGYWYSKVIETNGENI